MDLMKRLMVEEEGQGLVEYALIIALISIAALAFMPGIGEKVAAVFKKVKDVLDDVDTT